MAPQTERRLKSILLSVGAMGAVVLILNLAQSITQTAPPTQASPPPVAAYHPQKICEDAWTSVIDHKNEDPPYFDVKLRPGCWSGFLYLPKTWHTWYDEPVGDTNGWWVSVWYSGWPQGRGPYGPGNIPAFNGVPSVLRLQGNGTIRYYTNKAPDQPIPETPERTLVVPRQPEPILTAAPNFIYDPEKLCHDSAEQELHYEQNQIDHFNVTMQEGCWSPLIYVPNSWQSSYYAESLGKEPDWWVAIWLEHTGAPRRKVPHGAEMFERRGPFTRNDSNSSPYWKGWYSPVFRLQGKGEIYFSHTSIH